MLSPSMRESSMTLEELAVYEVREWLSTQVTNRSGRKTLLVDRQQYTHQIQRYLTRSTKVYDILPDGTRVDDLKSLVSSITFERFLAILTDLARLKRGHDVIAYSTEVSDEFVGVVAFSVNVRRGHCVCWAISHPAPDWLREKISRALFRIAARNSPPGRLLSPELALGLATMVPTARRDLVSRVGTRLAIGWQHLPEALFLLTHRLRGWRRVALLEGA